LNWVDFFIIVVLVVAFANGYRRGAFKEISTFIGLILAIMLGVYYADWLAAKGSGRFNFSPSLIYLISFALIFLAAQVLLKLLGHLYYKMVKITPLKKYDRVIGGGFGLLKGTLVLSLLFLMFIFFPGFQSFNGAIDRSSMAPVFRKIVPITYDMGMQLHPSKSKFVPEVKSGILGSKAATYAEDPEEFLEKNEILGMTSNDVGVLNSLIDISVIEPSLPKVRNKAGAAAGECLIT